MIGMREKENGTKGKEKVERCDRKRKSGNLKERNDEDKEEKKEQEKKKR